MNTNEQIEQEEQNNVSDELTSNEESVQKFIEGCQAVINEHYAAQFETLIPPTLRVEERNKFLFVFRHGAQDSAYCFIAKTSFQNKALGNVVRGDVFKSASWKVPAKHARGNVFSPDAVSQMTAYGPNYLRGGQF